MKTLAKNIFFLLCLLPLLVKFPYMLEVWESSPLESGDPIMWCAIPLSALLCELVRRKLRIQNSAEKNAPLVVTILGFALAAWFLLGFKINALGILTGILIAALGVDLRFGRKVFVSQLPTYLFAVLACPSVSFWLDYYLNAGLGGAASYLVVKFAFATSFMLLWCATAAVKLRYPRIINVIFYVSVCIALLYSQIAMESLATGDSFYIDESRTDSGDWLANNMEVGVADRKFFSGCSKIVRKSYFNNNSSVILLGLHVDRISNIHPIGICLKSSGMKILKSRQLYVDINGRSVQMNELAVKNAQGSYLVYSWFSTDEVSTGDFTRFRVSGRALGKWRHYQIILPLGNSEVLNTKTAVDFFEKFDSQAKTSSI